MPEAGRSHADNVFRYRVDESSNADQLFPQPIKMFLYGRQEGVLPVSLVLVALRYLKLHRLVQQVLP